MNLANTIIENRKKNGWSQEDLAYKLDVSRQSVSKWESAQSQPDLNKIIRMSELFNVSTDYLLKGQNFENENNTYTSSTNIKSNIKEPIHISNTQGDEFLKTYKSESKKIANATMLCIISASILILIGNGDFSIYINIMGVASIVILLGIAIYLYIMGGTSISSYAYLNKNNIELDQFYKKQLQENFSKLDKKLIFKLALSVAILVVVFAAFVNILFIAEDYAHFILSITLVLASLCINTLIRVGIEKSSYQQILRLGDYARVRKKHSALLDNVIGGMWGLIVMGYLIYSFETQNWDISWIVFPIFGIITGIVYSVYGSSEE